MDTTYIQTISGTDFFYERLRLEGEFRGVKYYQVKNKETGFVTVISEKEIKPLTKV